MSNLAWLTLTYQWKIIFIVHHFVQLQIFESSIRYLKRSNIITCICIIFDQQLINGFVHTPYGKRSINHVIRTTNVRLRRLLHLLIWILADALAFVCVNAPDYGFVTNFQWISFIMNKIIDNYHISIDTIEKHSYKFTSTLNSYFTHELVQTMSVKGNMYELFLTH